MYVLEHTHTQTHIVAQAYNPSVRDQPAWTIKRPCLKPEKQKQKRKTAFL